MAKTIKTNKDKDLKISDFKTMTKAQEQRSQSMKEHAYNKIKIKTKTQELNDKAISTNKDEVLMDIVPVGMISGGVYSGCVCSAIWVQLEYINVSGSSIGSVCIKNSGSSDW
ncbi:hypothetical protein Tco_0737055 [Tanacetum coccineum]